MAPDALSVESGESGLRGAKRPRKMSTGGSGDAILSTEDELLSLADVLFKESSRSRSASPGAHPPISPARGASPAKRDSVMSTHSAAASERSLDSLHVRRARRSSVSLIDIMLHDEDAGLHGAPKRCCCDAP